MRVGVLALALSKLLLLATAVVVGDHSFHQGGGGQGVALPLRLVFCVVFGVAAVATALGSRPSSRARGLALVFALIAAAFLPVLVASESVKSTFWVEITEDLLPEVFLAFALWSFALEFPRTPAFGTDRPFARSMVWLSFATAVVLQAGSLSVGRFFSRPVPMQDPLQWRWAVVAPLVLGALVFILWKSRRVSVDERRRTRLFVAGLALGLGPLFVEVMAQILIPPYARFMQNPQALRVGGLILYPLLLSIPFTTAYAIRVHKALDVKLVVRKALQYVFARFGVLTATLVPFVALVAYFVLERDRSLGDLFVGPQGLLILTLIALGVIAFASRGALLNAVDRRFFRQQYDAREILTRLASRVGEIESLRGLLSLVSREVDRALHLESVSALVERGRGWESAMGPARGLEPSAALASLLESGSALDLDGLEGTATGQSLSEADRVWLADTGARMLVPILRRNRSVAGILVLGEKRSELPFSTEDRELLQAIASNATLAVESFPTHGSEGIRAPDEAPATECVGCGGVEEESGREACSKCDRPLVEALVPFWLAGKYRLESRLGSGGMGVVYRAQDVDLDRTVALKALPRVSAPRTLQLRREARAMAAVSHPNLAIVFGLESWFGRPVLVVEFLGGGTLADRLQSGKMGVAEALQMTITLADAVHHLHQRGILHRDVKPGNVGFTAEGAVKLLDFGLARMSPAGRTEPPTEAFSEAPTQIAAEVPSGLGSDPAAATARIDATGTLEEGAPIGWVGTPAYMPPEALRAAEPGPYLDVWGLGVLLYESLTGENPFAASTRSATLARIQKGLEGVESTQKDLPEPLVDLLRRTLSVDAGKRPRSARRLGANLSEVAGALQAAAA